jgi:hypothetical protein
VQAYVIPLFSEPSALNVQHTRSLARDLRDDGTSDNGISNRRRFPQNSFTMKNTQQSAYF